MPATKDNQKYTLSDWGDGTKVTVVKPDLSGLAETTYPVDCFPDGVEGTGKVIAPSSPPPELKNSL
jgi:hypothetical protein